MINTRNVFVILNNVRSSENVGSIFRTSDASGVEKIILVGITPSPFDRFGRENTKLAKASLGSEKVIKWEKEANLKEAVMKLKKEKFKIVGIEQDEKAVDYRKIKNEKFKNIALVFGNEVDGLSKDELSLCDLSAYVPMCGTKESLNVSVCAGIVLYSFI